jgi:hypothetical protein
MFYTVDSDMSIATIRQGGAHDTRINHQNEIINENSMYTASANADGRMSCFIKEFGQQHWLLWLNLIQFIPVL